MPSGSRLWRFKYRFPPRAPGNKEKCISLGAYPEVSLERARKRRDAARLDVVNGTDPSLRRVCERVRLASPRAGSREVSRFSCAT
jgi:Arm DNA-binding domain